MKKYIISCFIVAFILGIIYYVQNYTSFILFSHTNVRTNITAKGKNIYFNNKPFSIKAINIGSYKAGNDDADYSITYNDYISWFKKISELNINTIRVSNIQSPKFYKALSNYNKKSGKKLYLIQGTDVGDLQKNSKNSYFENDTYSDIFENIRQMVDVIHGRRIITKNREFASGIYTTDVSKYTIAYVIGTDWNDATVEYTNQKYKDKNNYKGKYFYANNVKPFEVYLAKVLDTLVNYESKKYGEQKLVSIGSNPMTDPFNYDEAVTDFYNKFTSFDIANIKTRKKLKSGVFASFQVYSAYPDFYGYDTKDSYYLYLKKLNEHYKIPLFISEFGYSTARLTNLNPLNDTFGDGFYDEKEQGEMIVKSLKVFKDLNINNFAIYEWLDEFDKSSWNNMYAVDTKNNQMWNNVLTYSQHFGLATYDTYTNDKKIIVIDGKSNDWGLKNPVIDNNNYKLYMSYDKAYINMLLEVKSENVEDKIYIPIDTTTKSGTKNSEIGNLRFSRNADFLIEINKNGLSKIYVQDYYNPIRALYGKQVYQHDPYEKNNIPKKNSKKFEDILNIIGHQELIKNNDSYDIINKVTTVNTGNLNYGVTNMKSNDYNSLADYYINKNVIELRIPYGLLNFADPATMRIHDDYYKNYGVEYIRINNMYVGVGNEGSKIKLHKFKLKGWGKKFNSKERMKKSYYIVKEYLEKS